jgi:hypothetical protein
MTLRLRSVERAASDTTLALEAAGSDGEQREIGHQYKAAKVAEFWNLRAVYRKDTARKAPPLT